MKIVHVETLIEVGSFSGSRQWRSVRSKLHRAIKAVHWPPGSKGFTIFPQSGKRRGEGNGVRPIKNECIAQLLAQGWSIETQFTDESFSTWGGLDATLLTRQGLIAMEWETGNISLSHRALKKMALCLLRGQLAAATLVVPSRRLYRFLTDRIGNYSELEPYLDLWRSIPCSNGVLEIVREEASAGLQQSNALADPLFAPIQVVVSIVIGTCSISLPEIERRVGKYCIDGLALELRQQFDAIP